MPIDIRAIFEDDRDDRSNSRPTETSQFAPASGIKEDLETIATLATANLARLVAIDSESFEDSPTIPSSEGQRTILQLVRGNFERLGYKCEQDPSANLIVRIPATSAELAALPAVALMVHVDTSEGTKAVPELCIEKLWDGSNVRYPKNPALNVSASRYPELVRFVGEDLIHGPGDFPFGLDDKLGCSILETLALLLRSNPDHQHGPVLLVFRPDEEIGREAAVTGLAEQLAAERVPCGFTLDGIEHYEVNLECFHAAQAKLFRDSRLLEFTPDGLALTAEISIVGVTTHGATAKAEGHLNATTVFCRAMERLADHRGIIATAFVSDKKVESNGTARFVVCGDTAQEIASNRALLEMAFGTVLDPHSWKGASFSIETRGYDGTPIDDGAGALAKYLKRFYAGETGFPLLPEESAGRQGYSNPYYASTENGQLYLRLRLRDFEESDLENRAQHAQYVANDIFGENAFRLEVESQYRNMGPTMAGATYLVDAARRAAEKIGVQAPILPIRGGTGVEPFVSRGILVPNLGTGYFAPESEKELTTRQSMGRHVLWIAALLQELV